jgi:TolB protein
MTHRRVLGPGTHIFIALTACIAMLSACTGTIERDEQTPRAVRLSDDLIAFAADLNGSWDFYEGDADVFVIDPDGGPAHNLTQHPANDFSPEWSPDGGRVAFRTDRDGNHEIYVINADGSEPVNLTRTPDDEERSPAWSPDGTQIAFSSDRDHDRDIYLMNDDGSNVLRLALPGLQEYPTWSPDGPRSHSLPTAPAVPTRRCS